MWHSMDSASHTTLPSDSLRFRSPGLEQGPKPSSAIEAERQTLFEKLSTATSVVHNIKSRINIIAPVSRLHVELLACIFFILRDVQSISPRPRELKVDRPTFEKLGWIVVTQVCSRWRDVAINCPALWTKVTFDRGSRWADHMLLRSKHAPVEILVLHYKGDRWALTQDAKRIASHISHTSSLNISTTTPTGILEVSLKELLRPALILRSLSLGYQTGYEEYKGDVLVAPTQLFANDTPCLREVSLNNVFVPWSSTLFKDLHSLHICLPITLPSLPRADRYEHFVPTLTKFLDVLDNNPSLHTLVIQGALPLFSAENELLFTMDRKVSLPQLQMLNLGGKILDVTLVLSRLAVPSDVSLSLECTSCDNAKHISNLFCIISYHLGTSDPISARNLTLDCESGFEIWGSMAFKSGRPLHLVFKFDLSVDDGDTMERFFAALPQIEVSRMDISYISLSSSAWQRVLRMPNAAAIHALSFDRSPDPLNDVYTLLCSFVSVVTDSSAAEEPVLPNLQSLTFNELCAEDMTPVQRFAFLAALECRRTLKLPLEKSIFDHCSALDGEWLDELRKIVPRVIVFDDDDCE